ncbi:ATP-binding domain-containing protein [Actinokineospora auranticolor]|uniref:DNA helicase IV n=1 Tax=Actinokineospora auranticolor TaxID=155976 RepID=A0A2S6GMA3_9PSEU|nr:ATP-binding domain-containing protein [Actinokineospora auranticolor]PPK66347.1 DNA helicase IV [Actinokineospora auranticolor]
MNQPVLEPEIRAERDYMDLCRVTLTAMREEVAAMLATGAGEGDAVVDKYLNNALREVRVRALEELADLDDVPLFFGRLDFPPGEVHDGDVVRAAGSPTHPPDRDLVYIGRRGVRDDDGEPLVIDWRAAVSRAFYEAAHQDPMGVRVRRRYGFDTRGLVTAYEDEALTPRAAAGGDGLLAAEIERPRKGPMRDIVATIQPEQMRLVRAPLGDTVCVQGAPGTGKTAVGLHRLAYLLYAERDRLRRDGGVAVIGPNRAFLSYIRNVLPALGEVEVAQTTIEEVTGARLAVGRVDEPDAARVKGDARMAEVVRRYLRSRIRRPVDGVEVKRQNRVWRVPVEYFAAELDAVLARDLDYGPGRDLLAKRLALRVLRRMELSGIGSSSVEALARDRGIDRALRAVWPAVNAARVVFDLLTDAAVLAEAADGVLSPDEQQVVLRTPKPRSVKAMTWSSLDLALLDEVAGRLARPARLGHVVVDEAQDLSPMHLRAIARRLAGSCTVLGDLAQATSPAAVSDWAAVLTHLDRADGRIAELTRGYRVPAQIIDFAARLLPRIAPDLRGPASFRSRPGALNLEETTPEKLAATISATCATALVEEGSVALIAADADLPAIAEALADGGFRYVVLGDDADPEAERLALVPVTLAKGLEFDTVLVVEPSRIATAEQRGLQRLYVALTRAVTTLHVIHADPLPEALRF